MAVKTVNTQSFDATIGVGTTVQAVQNVNNSSQSFGDALTKASDKLAGETLNSIRSMDISRNVGQQGSEMNAGAKSAKESEQVLESSDKTAETEKQNDITDEKSADKTNEPDEKLAADETADDSADKITTEQIADALTQIIGQLKELLGVSDEEILAGMESIDIQPTDLLNSDNLVPLLTAIAGEGEVISLVTDENLYAALQELTTVVENVSSQLSADTGLTQEELNAVLEEFSQVEDLADGGIVQQVNFDEEAELVTNTADESAVQSQEEAPLVIVEENAKLQETGTTQKQLTDNKTAELPENQQENPTDEETKIQSGKSEQNTHGQEGSSKNFDGQQGMVQSYGDNLNEAAQATAETAMSYTSESTESILRQLADAVKIIKNENLTEMELQLHPASLGTVNVSLVTKGGTVTAEFTTQSEAVKAAIESQIAQLRANLEEQGIKVEAIEVSVASHELERNLDKNNQDEQSRQEQEEKQRVQGVRRNSINLNSFADDDELVEEMQEADDATRIAMEMMAASGNSMDLAV